MTGFKLDERTRLSIELALTARSRNSLLLQQQDADAERLGMTGAEVDAARRGWSFDVRTSMALALAMASDEQDREKQRERALRAGITEEACCEVEDLAGRFVALSFSGEDQGPAS